MYDRQKLAPARHCISTELGIGKGRSIAAAAAERQHRFRRRRPPVSRQPCATLAPPDEPTTATALCALIAEPANNLTATVVDTLPEAISSSAEVLILVLPEYPVADLEDAFVQRLEGRKVIGIG